MDKLIKIDKIMPDSNVKDIISFTLSNDIVINLKRNLSIPEVLQFTKDVIEGLVDKENRIFLDEMKSFMIRLYFLFYYTNIDLPTQIEDQYDFVISHSGMINQMMDSVDQNQLSDIISAIVSKENVIKQSFVQYNEQMDILLVGLNNLMFSINQIINDNMDSMKNIDIQQLIQNLSQKNLSESEVINQILEHNKGVKPNRETRRKIDKNKGKAEKVIPINVNNDPVDDQ